MLPLLEDERSAKRAKLAADVAATATLAPTLPPDAWAAVMEYVLLSDVISLSLTCREIYCDAIPLLKRLHIRKASELNSGLAKRFRDIRDIFIYSLVESALMPVGYDGDSDVDIVDTFYSVNFETSVRAASFLSNNFSKLERVFFGGEVEADEEEYQAFVPYVEIPEGKLLSFASSHRNMTRLVDNISAAFRCGALPPTLSVRGLRCLRSGQHQVTGRVRRITRDCSCRLACESFPLSSAAMFECKGSSQTQVDSERSYNMDVCLSREEMERIIQMRAGGHDFLRSKERLLHLLGRGKRVHFSSPSMIIVHYTDAQISLIDRVIKTSELDVTKFTSTEITEAVMRSFYQDERCPPSFSATSCFFSDKSREHLQELGLPLEDDNLENFRGNAVTCLDSIVDAIRWDIFNIRNEGLSLLAKMVSLKENPLIQEVMDSDVLPTLIGQFVKAGCSTYIKSTAVRILTAIMMKESNVGTDNGREVWPGAVSCLVLGEQMQPSHQGTDTSEIISFIVQATNVSATACNRYISVSIVSEIVKRQKKDQLDAIVEANAVPNLCSYLCENSQTDQAVYALSTLSIIAQTSPTYRQLVLDSGVLTNMSATINKSQQLSRDWVSFVHAMVKIDHNPSFLKRVAGGIASLVQAIKNGNSIQIVKLAVVEILSVVLVKLGSDSDIIKTIVDAGTIPYFVDCLCIPQCHEFSLQNALGGLSIIARASATYRDDLLKTPVMNHLNLVCGRLRPTATAAWNNCILLLRSMYMPGKNTSLMASIGLKLMALLDKDGDLSTLALNFCKRLLREKKVQLTDALVEAGMVSRLTVIASGDDSRTAQGALCAIQDILHSPNQEKVLPEVIACAGSGLRQKCSERRMAWLVLVQQILVREDQNVPVIQALIDHGVVNALVEELQPEINATEAFLLLALDVLLVIAGANTDYRDRLLQTEILTCISHHVKESSPTLRRKGLVLIFLLSRCSEITALAEKIGGLAAFLVDMMGNVDENLASDAVFICHRLLGEKKAVYTIAMVKAGIAPILSTLACDDDSNMAQTALRALGHIVDCSTECRDLVTSEIMDHVFTGITDKCSKRSTAWSILVYKMIALKDGQNTAVIQALVDREVVNALIDALRPEKYSMVTVILHSLDVLSVVAKASVVLRDQLLNAKIVKYVGCHLKRKQLALQKKCIAFLCSTLQHDENKSLVQKIFLELAPSLVELMSSDDDELSRVALSLCENLLREKHIELTNAMLGAGVISKLTHLASTCNSQIARTSLLVLEYIVDCCPHSRGKFVTSEIMGRLCCGIREKSFETRDSWIFLIYKMVAEGQGQSVNKNVLQALIDYEVIKALIEFVQSENQSLAMALVKFILISAQPHFNERKSIRISWLQKRRVWLMVDGGRDEVEQFKNRCDSIKMQLDEMRRKGRRDSIEFQDLTVHLEAMESRLRTAQQFFGRLRNYAERIASYNTWHERLKDLPHCIEKVDDEITRCENEMQELRYLLNNASFTSIDD